jgi:hypothetical protein
MPTDDKAERLKRKLEQYRGFVFRWQAYKELAPDWDHDHCNGCWARFAERPEEWGDVVHTEGWVTLWSAKGTGTCEDELIAKWRAQGHLVVPSPKPNGFQLDWLCPTCFETCREEFGFVIDPEHPQWQKAGLWMPS